MAKEMMPVWYLAGPFYQYNEDVKALAKKAGVRIIDANMTTSREGAADPADLPTVTRKDDAAPAAPVVAPPADEKPATAAMIDIVPGLQISQMGLEAKAIEASGLTPGKFKQLKKAEREAFVVAALETLKATEAARNLGQ